MGKSWLTVPLEIGHNEIGDAEEIKMDLAGDVAKLFREIGLPEPDPVPLMPLHHQIAQKLHALTEPKSMRAHDLIDLQIIMKEEQIDLTRVCETCEKLFSYRQAQVWPAQVVQYKGWDTLYEEQRGDLDILQNVSDAVKWANNLIEAIVASK